MSLQITRLVNAQLSFRNRITLAQSGAAAGGFAESLAHLNLIIQLLLQS